MLHWLAPQSSASFPSPLSLDDAVARLSASVPRWRLDAPFRDAVIGLATAHRVVLEHRRRFIHTRFGVQFVGSFHSSRSVTTLAGAFRLHPVSVGFSVFCLLVGASGLFTALASPHAATSTTGRPLFTLVSALVTCTGLLLPRLLLWTTRRDRAAIEEQIAAALLTNRLTPACSGLASLAADARR